MLQDVNKSARPLTVFNLFEPISSSSVNGDNDCGPAWSPGVRPGQDGRELSVNHKGRTCYEQNASKFQEMRCCWTARTSWWLGKCLRVWRSQHVCNKTCVPLSAAGWMPLSRLQGLDRGYPTILYSLYILCRILALFLCWLFAQGPSWPYFLYLHFQIFK